MKSTQPEKTSLFLTEPLLGGNLKASSVRKRMAFECSWTRRKRKEASTTTFNYKTRDKDTIDPRPHAREIKKALAENTPLTIINEIETGVHLMVFCAGNILSLDVPLEAQHLAAFQRIADYHVGLLLNTREETLRLLALCRASTIVNDALAAYRRWKKEVSR